MKKKKKKLKQFEIEFVSRTYRTYNVKAECAQLAKLIAWEDMEKDEGNSWHWKNNAELAYVGEIGIDELDIPF